MSIIKVKFFLLFVHLILFNYSYCSLQRVGINHDSELSVQSLNSTENKLINNQVSRDFCQYTDFRWSSCLCDRNVIIGIRFLLSESKQNCAPEVSIVELPCDKTSCNQKLLSTSDGVACPSLSNIDGACDPSNFLADVMAKSFETCRTFCNVMVNCTHFVLDKKNSRCRLYTGKKVCGREVPGLITGLVGFDSNSCTDCTVGTWGSLSECVKPENFDPKLIGCGEAQRKRDVKGPSGVNCPYKTETWTCSLSGQTCDMRIDISDIFLNSSDVSEGGSSESYKLLEISLIFAGLVTGVLIFMPISLIYPKVGIFFYGKKLYYIISGNEITANSSNIEETATNLEDYEEWDEDEDVNVEYETEFTLDNR